MTGLASRLEAWNRIAGVTVATKLARALEMLRPLQLDILFLGPSSSHLLVGRPKNVDKSISYTSLPVVLNALFPVCGSPNPQC